MAAPEVMAAPAAMEERPARRHVNSRRPRSASLENYTLVERQRAQTPDDEIRVTGGGRVSKYVSYAAKLLTEQNKTHFTVRATGVAISVAISVCEVLKRRVKGLHQVTSIGWTDIIDEYRPLQEGLPNRTEKRSVPSLSVFLSTDESLVDKTAVGYQPPLDESFVDERDPEYFATGGARRQRRPRRSQRNEMAEPQEGQNNNNNGENRPRRRNQRPRRPRGPRYNRDVKVEDGVAVPAGNVQQ